MRLVQLAILLALAACTAAPQQASAPAPIEIALAGEITRADHQTYREIPFEVPPGTGRIAVDFSYTGKDQRTVIDIGLRDPDGQRGWSGGNKSHFEIAEFSATPSYATGPLKPGTWHLVLGVPNIRDGQTASYTATIQLGPSDGASRAVELADPAQALAATPGWRRGDFHVHTAHSDGSCDQGETRGPCPAVFTFAAAQAAGLDFVAVTDHNTITQLRDIRELQHAFPATLLIPGTEITTFFGHANAIGNTGFLDFQLGSPRLPTLAKLFDQVEAAGGFISVNHPSLPSGEVCMGCGWTAKDTDWSRVAAIEIVNGSTLRTGGAESPLSGIKFWVTLLNQGHRVTAIGGSDNHDAKDTTGAKQSPIGKPATVVYASELSTKGIVAGVKSGRAFVDVAGLPGATLDIAAVAASQVVKMGGEFRLRDGQNVALDAIMSGLPEGARVEPISHGLDVFPQIFPDPNQRPYVARLTDGAEFGWLRFNVRDKDGKLLLIGNPIYVRRDATSP
ncbi:MAG: hypothetical protein B7Y90_06900 [Alphaproteobacteria bacterium 32-64-14]|nr:MAG: hypothetical protein B7Y90_06900 [Alphaproteobacteria bacterium 32-64-14]